jgi:hypothetical protein
VVASFLEQLEMIASLGSPRGIAPFVKSRSKWELFSTKSAEKKYKTYYQETQILDSEGGNEHEQNSLIQQLQNEISFKNQKIQELQSQLELLSLSPSLILQRKHQFLNETYLITDEGQERAPMATRGSMLTSNILRALPEQKSTPMTKLAQGFLEAFKNPLQHLTYLKSNEFANDLIELCYHVCDLLEEEPRCHFLQSPVYVIGDIHGNLEDLHFFSDNLWKLGLELSAGKYLFLGDYVDRGMNCLECVAYLFALKLLYPSKIYLLR